MKQIATIIGLWVEGLLSYDEVIAWADDRILVSKCPENELIELSLKGPELCSKKPSYEFPAPRIFTFLERFALRAVWVDIESCSDMNRFMEWLIRACIGENFELPEVALGYHVDHYAWDCDDKPMAIQHLKNEMEKLLPKCYLFVSQLESECLPTQSKICFLPLTQSRCADS
ncbi:hypothetical protein [Cellvibrio polysaccharolyticus]|uniref:Uncharacterized protein n=1 Tax=Cellvibrio polysaccharolyticus TaxID=2082724 RepID=A0A928V3M7_9GAMM|nr:hypothetical protein [Cellvibrio polysaccharolyticus]MBE8718171.1 hypothetical protein [Cellvibrio polysaccharolyticus]